MRFTDAEPGVGRVGARAGIHAHIHPHLLRHAYGDHIAKQAGLLVAQAVLGHASVETTRSTYVDRVSLDQLADATRDVTYHPQLSPQEEARMPRKAPTGIEPVESDSRPVPRDQALGGILVDLRSAFAGLSWETAA